MLLPGILAAVISTALLGLLFYGAIRWNRVSPIVATLVVWNGLVILFGVYPSMVSRYVTWGVFGEVLAGLIWWLRGRGLGAFPTAAAFITFLIAEIYFLQVPARLSAAVLILSVFAVVEAIIRGEE